MLTFAMQIRPGGRVGARVRGGWKNTIKMKEETFDEMLCCS